MPYVPSEKTPLSGNIKKYEDRIKIEEAVYVLSKKIAQDITTNDTLIDVYINVFSILAEDLNRLNTQQKINNNGDITKLSQIIFNVAKKYEYDGAFLGELNYAVTRLILLVPKIKVQNREWKSALRYWYYARTVEALIYVSNKSLVYKQGIAGVFEDIKDEYKWRVNRAYEIYQIKKSGDCYHDAPYHSQPVKVVNKQGKIIGYMEVHMSKELYNGHDISGEIVIK